MIHDFRIALRSLLRSPGFLATSVLSLALAIGASVAAFSVLDAVRFRALPFVQANRLVVLGETSAEGEAGVQPCRGACDVSYVTFANVLNRFPFRTLDAVAAYATGAKSLSRNGDAILVTGGVVSPNVFQLLDAHPALGRAFVEDDNRVGAPLVTVLTHDLWATHFGSDPNILGRDVKLSDSHYTVIGVMPPGFRFEVNSDFWLPAVPTLDPSTRPSIRSMTVIGRLAPGRTIEQLRGELATVETAAGGARPGERTVIVADPLRARYATSTQSHDVAFAAIVGCVLLIACANLANLMLVRTIQQQREHAIRAALGARAGRLVRSIVVQNAIVVVLAALLGVALASASLGVLRALPALASLRPPGMDYRIDARVLAFATLIATLAAVTISLVPGRVAARGDVHQLLRGTTGRGSAGGRGWTQHVFVVAQVACATVLLTGALLMAKTVMRLASVNLGFESSHLVSGSPSYPHTWRVKEVYMPVTDRIIGDLVRLPGVRDVAVRATVPIAMRNGVPAITVEGSAEPLARGVAPRSALAVSPGYFATMGVPIVRGREFTGHDDEQGAPVAIVNRWAAARWWPNADAIGRIVRVGVGDSAQAVTIVGVAADNKAAQVNLLLADDGAELYRPYRQAPTAFPTFFARATGNPVTLVRPMRELLTRAVPDRPVFTTVMSETAKRQLGGVRANALQIAGFAIVGLVLAMIGVYGVLSFDMSRRTRELGIRGALGASRGNLTGMVLRDAARVTGLGVLIGLPVAAFAMRVIRGLLYSTNPRDGAVYAGVAACVAAVAMIAAYLPARRAARVDPLIAMRAE